MSDDIQTADQAAETEAGLIAYMFTNHPEQGPMMQSLLDMYYRGAYSNTIGIQSAYNKETGEEELLIVGVEHDGETTNAYPLARILGPGEAANYVGPDGKGGWLDDNDLAPEQLELDFDAASVAAILEGKVG